MKSVFWHLRVKGLGRIAAMAARPPGTDSLGTSAILSASCLNKAVVAGTSAGTGAIGCTSRSSRAARVRPGFNLRNGRWAQLVIVTALGVVRLGTASTEEYPGAANSFRPHELVRAGREDGQSPRIEYRLLWPEVGKPDGALSTVRAAIWNAWAADPSNLVATPPPLEPANVLTAMTEVADRITTRFREFRRMHPNAPGIWSDVRRVDMVSRVEPWLSITITHEWCWGTAHPVRRIQHFVFDLVSGRPLAPEDLFGLIGREEFARRVQQALIAERLDSAEHDLLSRAVIVPTNFFVDHRGIGVTFNEGEIAPHGVGSITVRLSHAEIEDLLAGAKQQRQ